MIDPGLDDSPYSGPYAMPIQAAPGSSGLLAGVGRQATPAMAGQPPYRLLVLGRDGVPGDDGDGFSDHPEQWAPHPDSLDALSRLHHAGLRIAVATNLSDLGSGLLSMHVLLRLHRRLVQLVESGGGRIDAVAICPHLPDAHCGCRKPMPGLLIDLQRRFDVEPAHILVVGSSVDDMLAARAAGCDGWLLQRGADVDPTGIERLPDGIDRIDDLRAAADRVLQAAAQGATVPTPAGHDAS